MKENVTVSLRGIRTGADEGKNDIKASGRYRFVNGKHVVKYEERKEEGGSSRVLLSFNDKLLEMSKSGDASIRLHFEKGKSGSAIYSLPYGNIMVKTKTRELSFTEKEDLMEILLIYDLMIEGAGTTRFRLDISIEPERN